MEHLWSDTDHINDAQPRGEKWMGAAQHSNKRLKRPENVSAAMEEALRWLIASLIQNEQCYLRGVSF